MPVNYAKRLAQLLMEEQAEQITVDVENDGFSEQVAVALEEMGHRVERSKSRPTRLTIHRARV